MNRLLFGDNLKWLPRSLSAKGGVDLVWKLVNAGFQLVHLMLTTYTSRCCYSDQVIMKGTPADNPGLRWFIHL